MTFNPRDFGYRATPIGTDRDGSVEYPDWEQERVFRQDDPKDVARTARHIQRTPGEYAAVTVTFLFKRKAAT